MGQAQRSDRKNLHRSSSRDHISLIYGDDSRSRARDGSQSRNSGERSARSGSGGRGRAGNASREGARRRHTDRDLQGLELWELSEESENPRLMRLADRESTRSGQRRSPSARRSSGSVKQAQSRPRSASAVRRRKAKRRKVALYRCFTLFVVAVCLILIYQTTGAVYRMVHDRRTGRSAGKDKGIVEVMSEKLGENKIEPPAITEDLLEINEYSRPGTKLKKVKSIFVHYTANPGTSAQGNRSYFANLAETHERAASAHFIIGYDGEVIQCIPREEQAYAVISRNEDSLSIECCYLDEDGKFTKETYDTLIHMLAWLTQEYHLTTDNILRHYDCGGKLCPLYYVEHEDAWEQMLADVDRYIEENGQ